TTKAITPQIDPPPPVRFNQLVDDRREIFGEPCMVQSRAQMLGAPAVPHVQPNHVEAGVDRLVRGAEHVSRSGRAFESVNQNQHRAFGSRLLPRTMSQNLDARCGLKQSRLASQYFISKPPTPNPTTALLPMALTKP